MAEQGSEAIESLHREELERLRSQSLLPHSLRPQPSYPLLPEGESDSPVAEEWAIFRREVARLIRESGKGRFALIKAGQPITIWDTLHDAVQAGGLLHGQTPCLVQQILPYLRPLSTRYLCPCLN
jgi:hypothetical protein